LLVTRHSPLITVLIQPGFDAVQGDGGLSIARFLFEGEAVMFGRFYEPPAFFVNVGQIEMRVGVGIIARREQRTLEPAD